MAEVEVVEHGHAELAKRVANGVELRERSAWRPACATDQHRVRRVEPAGEHQVVEHPRGGESVGLRDLEVDDQPFGRVRSGEPGEIAVRGPGEHGERLEAASDQPSGGAHGVDRLIE